MTGKVYSLLLGATLVATPALAQDNTATSPTANSAASQVGQPPPAALDSNGKQVEPSQKLWNNPRTEAEQPGTQPPPNDRPVTSAETATGAHAYQSDKHKGTKHKHHKTQQDQTKN